MYPAHILFFWLIFSNIHYRLSKTGLRPEAELRSAVWSTCFMLFLKNPPRRGVSLRSLLFSSGIQGGLRPPWPPFRGEGAKAPSPSCSFIFSICPPRSLNFASLIEGARREPPSGDIPSFGGISPHTSEISLLSRDVWPRGFAPNNESLRDSGQMSVEQAQPPFVHTSDSFLVVPVVRSTQLLLRKQAFSKLKALFSSRIWVERTAIWLASTCWSQSNRRKSEISNPFTLRTLRFSAKLEFNTACSPKTGLLKRVTSN